MTEYAVDPARMALVNVDMQVAFIEGTPLSAPDGVALIPIVNRLAEACRRSGTRKTPIPRRNKSPARWPRADVGLRSWSRAPGAGGNGSQAGVGV